jgi:DNA-binding GntR family transcriptional regulator
VKGSGLDIGLPVHGQRRTAHELVRDTLRRAILRGALPGGTRLVQADIAARLNVSTTPVREALRDLATEGLIRLDAHRGAIVYEPDLEEVRELYDLRKILEPEAMKRAVRHVTDEELQRAEAIQHQMDEEQDPAVWVDLNTEFHGLLADAARSPRLSSILKTLRDAAAVYVALALKVRGEQMVLGNKHHHELLDAMRRRDARAAAKIVVEHLDSTMRAVDAARTPAAS